jgi:hypothetical protein
MTSWRSSAVFTQYSRFCKVTTAHKLLRVLKFSSFKYYFRRSSVSNEAEWWNGVHVHGNKQHIPRQREKIQTLLLLAHVIKTLQ